MIAEHKDLLPEEGGALSPSPNRIQAPGSQSDMPFPLLHIPYIQGYEDGVF